MGNSKKGIPYTPGNELKVLSAEVSVRFCSDALRHAIITLNVPKKKGVWPALMQALHSHHVDILNATLTSNHDTNFHCIHCQLTAECEIESEEQLLGVVEDVIVAELRIRPCRV